MDFSVIIASRNRSVLVRAAIQSVRDQTHRSVEIIVVHDGSDAQHAPAYAAIRQELSACGSFIELRPTSQGHGQSYAYNRGAEVAQGAYLCFLDDDDTWTDPQHLSRAWTALSAPGGQAEVYFSNQLAYLADVPVKGPIWLEGLERQLAGRPPLSADGVRAVSVDDLMVCGNHAQVNILIVSRDLYGRVGGFDECIRYECDVDFYLRIIDCGNGLLYSPHYVSRHNVPDPSGSANMSTSLSPLAKAIARAQVWNKAFFYSSSPAIRGAARRFKGYALRTQATLLLKERRTRAAFSIGLEALGTHFSFKWLAFCLYMGVRAVFGEPQVVNAPAPSGTNRRTEV